MMSAANVPMPQRNLVYYEAFDTATKLESLVLIAIDGMTKLRVVHWGRKLTNYTKHLRTWGDAGTVKIERTGMPKVDNKGGTCMFVGYPDNHAGVCKEMLNWSTKGVLTTKMRFG